MQDTGKTQKQAKGITVDRLRDGTTIYRWRRMINGERLNGTCDTMAEALEAIDLVERRDRGEDVIEKRRLSGILDDYIEDLDRRDASSQAMRLVKRELLDWFKRQRKLADDPWAHQIKSGHLERWAADMLGRNCTVPAYTRKGKTVNGYKTAKPLSTRTVNKWLTMLTTAWDKALRMDHVTKNHAELTPRLRMTPRERMKRDAERSCYSVGDVCSIIQWLLDLDEVETVRRMVLMVALGPRPGAVKLSAQDVRWRSREIRCIQGKGSRGTWRPASDIAMAIVREAREELVSQGIEIRPDTILIGDHPLGLHHVRKMVKEARQELGIGGGGKVLHLMRSTWATWLAAAGVRDAMLRTIGGWSNVEVITGHYVTSLEGTQPNLSPLVSHPDTHADRLEAGDFSDEPFLANLARILDDHNQSMVQAQERQSAASTVSVAA